MKAIEALGFTACTPIQGETLPHALSDYDVVGQAQTGTGKTAAFLISIIAHQLEFPKDPLLPPGTPRALIVAPTRELAMQIADDAEGLCRFSGLRVLSVVGGMDFERQRRILEERRVDILVGTPGRLIDFITRGKLNLRQVEQLVLDEADRMLSMGFIPDVRRIVRQTPPKERRQTLLFSATFSETILRLASQWTLDAEQVVIEPESVATDRVEQRIYLVAEEDKFALLYNLMQDLELERVIVFANRRDSTRLIQTRLAALGVDCELLSGEVPQAKRLKTLERFKRRAHPGVGRYGRGWARPSRGRHQPRHQLRSPGRSGGLRAPHWPHGPGRRHGDFHQLPRRIGCLPPAGNRDAPRDEAHLPAARSRPPRRARRSAGREAPSPHPAQRRSF